MIAAVMGQPAALAALLLLLPAPFWAADDLPAAARELARKTAAFTGRGETVSITWRNLSSLGSADLAQARSAFESALRESGVRPSATAPTAEARLALSENQTQFLLTVDARKGDDRQVFISSWRRATAASAPAVSLEKKLLWEQPDPILDALPNGNDLFILSSTGVLLRGERGAQTAPIAPLRPWPRDLRGRLRVTATGIAVYLPGMSCTGAFDPALTLDCRASDDPWPLGPLSANFATTRNFFDGRIAAHKSVAPFYTLAALDPYIVLAHTDGHAQIYDTNLDPIAPAPSWGSDLADTHCGTTPQLLVTKPGDPRDPDTLRAFTLINRAPVPLTPPLDLPGPVTALWPLSGPTAVAVIHDLTTGLYSAWQITVICHA